MLNLSESLLDKIPDKEKEEFNNWIGDYYLLFKKEHRYLGFSEVLE